MEGLAEGEGGAGFAALERKPAPEREPAPELSPEPRGMRLAKRELREEDELRAVLERARVVRVGSRDGEGLFIVPMNFGFDWVAGAAAPTLWLHSAREGRKADAWKADPQVAFELDAELGLITGDFSCAYSLAYESIMGQGRVVPVQDADEARHGLEQLMAHMAPGAQAHFSEEALARTAVWRLDVERMSGKRREG